MLLLIDSTEMICRTSNLLGTWIPIIIAIIALATSIISTSITRRSYISENRPYVWSMSFRDIKTGKELPNLLMMINSNSPARIIRHEFVIMLGEEELYSEVKTDFVRYPNDRIQWTYEIQLSSFEHMRRRLIKCGGDKVLLRKNHIEYTSLSGGKTYFHELVQEFDLHFERWRDKMESGN